MRTRRCELPKLWILSDLHLESVSYPEEFRPKQPDFDILAVAGDIWEGDVLRGYRFMRQLAGTKPIVFVLGNHEHWNGETEENLKMAKLLANEYGITLLDSDMATIAGCQFIGTTLWTDYRLAPADTDPSAETGEQIDVAHDGGSHLITVEDVRRLHAKARGELEKLLANAKAGNPIVALTHHAPHAECLPPEHRNTWGAGNSASDLSHMTDSGQVALWIHGHIHNSIDLVRPRGTRILCNPAGPMFCNAGFNETLVVEV